MELQKYQPILPYFFSRQSSEFFIPSPKYYKHDNCWKPKLLRGQKFLPPKFPPPIENSPI